MRRILPVLAIAVLAVSCSHLKSSRFEPDRLSRVKTVAIVGVDAYLSQGIKSQIQDSVAQDILVKAMLSGLATSASAANETALGTKSIEEMPYQLLSSRLSSEFGWKVLTREQVATNPTYAAIAKAHHKEINFGTMRVPGILGGQVAGDLTPAERSALLKSLGVDALVSMELSYWADDTDQARLNDSHVWARLDFLLDDGGTEPAWQDIVNSKRNKDGIPPLFVMESMESLSQALAETTGDALELLVTNVRAACDRQGVALKPTAEQPAPAAEKAAPAAEAPSPAAQPAEKPAATPAAESPAPAEASPAQTAPVSQ